MRKILFILLLLPVIVTGQQIGGAGHNNGYYKCQLSVYLASDSSTTLISDGTYYLVNARMTDGFNVDFTFGTWGMKYIGDHDCETIFFGDADVSIDKNSVVTFALFKNSEVTPISGATTIRACSNANTEIGFSINRHVVLSAGDTLKVKAKSNTANTVITLKGMNLTIQQIK